jgi:hypothetical protein
VVYFIWFVCTIFTRAYEGFTDESFKENKSFKFVYVVVLCVFTFWVPCCDVRYVFCIETMFGLSLSPVVYRRAYVLLTLFVFVCVYWCPTHNVLYFCFNILRLVYHMLPVSLDYRYVIALWYSLTFIQKQEEYISSKLNVQVMHSLLDAGQEVIGVTHRNHLYIHWQ